MLALGDREAIAQVDDPELRALLEQRAEAILAEVGEDYELHEIVLFVVVEPGDALEAIDAQLGFPVLCTLDGNPMPASGRPHSRPRGSSSRSTPASTRSSTCSATTASASRCSSRSPPSVPQELLAMCAAYATPAQEDP